MRFDQINVHTFRTGGIDYTKIKICVAAAPCRFCEPAFYQKGCAFHAVAHSLQVPVPIAPHLATGGLSQQFLKRMVNGTCRNLSGRVQKRHKTDILHKFARLTHPALILSYSDIVNQSGAANMRRGQ
jgi:hypothetical protein